jgi:hypothetical protein
LVTEIQGIDNVFPDELAPERIAITMNLKVYRTPGNDPVADGIAPSGDRNLVTSTSTGGSPEQEGFLSSPYITVEIRDRVTDKTILFLPRAFLIRRSGSVEAESLMTETWTIKSIGYGGSGSQVQGLFQVAKAIFS